MTPTRTRDRRPTMSYWTSENGTILRSESSNADLLDVGDSVFAAPYNFCDIVGANLFQFIDGQEVSYLYRTLGARVLKTGRAMNFAYRCDSPAVRREMTMSISRDSAMVRYDSVVVSETRRERACPAPTPNAITLVAMCSFCQKYRFPVDSQAWKELESLLTEPGLPSAFKFSHGICDPCFGRVALAEGLL